MSKRIITLLTDFGLQDVYVGVMKGAIAKINPQLKAIDLTHNIPPQNITAGRFCLMSAYPYFPSETVHVAVVDPGVGSKRRGVAIELEDGFLVGPDNGLFTDVLHLSPVVAAVELTNSDYWLTPEPSSTFHGRDIFAPVGAYLASGVNLQELGKEIDPDHLISSPIPELKVIERDLLGSIQYIDYFGNLITNIPAAAIKEKSRSVMIGEVVIPIAKTYSDVALGEVVALVGSHGWLEIAVNGGSAKERLQVDWNETVRVI